MGTRTPAQFGLETRVGPHLVSAEEKRPFQNGTMDSRRAYCAARTWADVANISGNFQYCPLRPFVIVVGYLALPKDLDPTKPFWLWYKDAFGIVGCPSD